MTHIFQSFPTNLRRKIFGAGGVCLDLLIILVFKIQGPVQMWLLFLTLSPFTGISSCTKPPKMYPMGESWASFGPLTFLLLGVLDDKSK